MQTQRQNQVAEQIAHIAATFLERESNRQSLITVTRADVAPDLTRATVYFTVMPDTLEDGALGFVKRKRTEFRTYLKKHAHLRRLPFVDFDIDRGEKHRQHLDTLEI